LNMQNPTRFYLSLFVAVVLAYLTLPVVGQDSAPSADWTLSRLDSVGGHQTTKLGNPRIVGASPDQAMEFDGASAIVLDTNPLAELKQFTAEVVFRPVAGGAKEQRFVHFQEDGTENRLLFELRLIDGDRWFLDTFIKSGDGNYTQFADKFPHPLGPWYHAAVVMDGKTMRHFVNGVEEMATPVTFAPQKAGKTSIGVRLNRVSWYSGAVRRVRVTPRVLRPEEFLKP